MILEIIMVVLGFATIPYVWPWFQYWHRSNGVFVPVVLGGLAAWLANEIWQREPVNGAFIVWFGVVLIMAGRAGSKLAFDVVTVVDRRHFRRGCRDLAFYLTWVMAMLAWPTSRHGRLVEVGMVTVILAIMWLFGLVVYRNPAVQDSRIASLEVAERLSQRAGGPVGAVEDQPAKPVRAGAPAPQPVSPPGPSRTQRRDRSAALERAERAGYSHAGLDPRYEQVDVNILEQLDKLSPQGGGEVDLPEVAFRVGGPLHVVYARALAMAREHLIDIVDDRPGSWFNMGLVLRSQGRARLDRHGRV